MEARNLSTGERWKSFGFSILNYLTGFPKVTIRYRGHWQDMADAHRMILALIEDSPRGRRARSIAELWLREDER